MKLLKTIKHYRLLWRFNSAKREANRMNKITGKRYWVIRLLNKYHVLSTEDVKALKQQGIFKRELNHLRLRQVAAYHTR